MPNPTLYIARYRDPEDIEIPDDMTYDQYCQGVAGGPVLDYWWKLQTDLSGEANYGAAGAATLVMRGPGTGVTTEYPGIVSTTADDKSVLTTGGAFEWMNAVAVAIPYLGHFTIGGWFSIPSDPSVNDQLLIRTNMGGIQGAYRGLDVLLTAGNDYLTIVLGSNTNTNTPADYYRRVTNPGVFPRDAINFIAIYAIASSDPSNITIKLYINGVLQSLAYSSGTGTSISWPSVYPDDASIPNGYFGIAFGAAGDTYGEQMAGTYDEVFCHRSEITADQVAMMYALGTQ